jgi:hypothetical protein
VFKLFEAYVVPPFVLLDDDVSVNGTFYPVLVYPAVIESELVLF